MAEFFDNVMGGLNRGIKTISSKSKEILETTRLKNEVWETEQTIDKKYQALGKKVYAMLNKKAFDEEVLNVDCKEIAESYKKITGLEEAIEKAEQEALKVTHGDDAIICVKCRAANKSGDKFCLSCGSAITIEDKAKDKLCTSCGAVIKEGTKFCSRCGGRVG